MNKTNQHTEHNLYCPCNTHGYEPDARSISTDNIIRRPFPGKVHHVACNVNFAWAKGCNCDNGRFPSVLRSAETKRRLHRNSLITSVMN